ncbi:hypothetical protein [Paracidovorax wautersii]|uniref:Lipoprotein n=1 Tax=Paracidovorax wautersii TaxID=1177982 RepID=A0A1I2G856_9BURK|nr:hypothetical protein [Paracidovorax wautersii]SFF13150.1 hypothetical protein SAMN04489711_113147 [Paracidovorax wautersii]
MHRTPPLQAARLACPLALSSIFLLALTACGGGGGGGDTPQPPVTLTGSVMVNQAVKNAIVCLDLNANGSCDADEPASGRTGADGAYQLTYAPAKVTSSQAASASLIARMVPGTLSAADTTIDAADTTQPLASSAYVLRQVPGKAGQINPLTTLVASGTAAGMSEAAARSNAAVQLGIAESKIDNYQDDPASDPTRIVDNARLMAVVTAEALEDGATLRVADQNAAADAAAGDLVTLNYTSSNTYFWRNYATAAKPAGTAGFPFLDLRAGMASGAPLNSLQLYPQAYLNPTGWRQCQGDAVHNSTNGVPSRSLYCGSQQGIGYVKATTDLAAQAMAKVVADMQANSATNSINNRRDNAALLAALGSATFPQGASLRLRNGYTLNQPIFINSLLNDARPQSEATTLEQLIAAKPASAVDLTTAAGSLTLGLGATPQNNLRVAFTGTTSPTTGTVQLYDCALNAAATVASNCTATQTGTYAISTVNGSRVMRFAGHAATTASNQVNLYAEMKAPDGSQWIYRAREAKPDVAGAQTASARLNSSAWSGMKTILGFS